MPANLNPKRSSLNVRLDGVGTGRVDCDAIDVYRLFGSTQAGTASKSTLRLLEGVCKRADDRIADAAADATATVSKPASKPTSKPASKPKRSASKRNATATAKA